jgi:hypothetical protein
MTDDAFWGDWRSYCHEMNRFPERPDLLVAELMKSQATKSFMPPSSVSEEAWRYAAELWQVEISPQDLELLPQIGHVCTILGHDAAVDGMESGDSDYYYTNCNEVEFDDVVPEEGDEGLRILAKSYWEDGPYKEICAGLIQTLKSKTGLKYVPPEASVYALFEPPMVLNDEHSYDAINFSGITFKRGEQSWSPGWEEGQRAQELECDPSGDWVNELGWNT